MPLVAPGFDAVQRAEVVALTRIILPAQIFHVVGGLLSAALQARDRHLVPALAPLVYTSCIVIGGLVGGRAAGAYGFAWGVLAGSVLGPFGLPLAACARSGLRWTLRCDLRDRDLRGYVVRSLPIMLAWSIVVVDDWYLKREGSLVGEGAVATLTYAKNLMRVPIGVFGLAAGVAAYPALTRLVAEQRIGEMHRTVIATVRNLLVLSFAAQAVLSVCGDEIATLVYGQRRIGADELHDIGTCLALVSIGLSAWSAQTVLARGFYALGNTWLPAVLGTGIALVAYPVYVVARQSLGTYGLALSSSAAVIAYTLALAWLFERRVAREDPGASAASAGTVSFVMRSAAALAIAVAAGMSAGAALPRAGAPGMTIVRALSLAALTTAIFAGVSHLFGLREVAAMLRPVAARVRTSSRRSHETV
jgi:putative peptidoglycan lipid II flippase